MPLNAQHMKRKGFQALSFSVCTEPNLRLDTNLVFLNKPSNRRFGGANLMYKCFANYCRPYVLLCTVVPSCFLVLKYYSVFIIPL